MIYQVHHRTAIRYGVPVANARFNLRLQPFAWPGQHVSHSALTIEPRPARLTRKAGPYLVNTMRAEFDEELGELDISSSFTVEVEPRPVLSLSPALEQLRQSALVSRDLTALSPAPYLFASRIATADPQIGAWGMQELHSSQTVLDLAVALSSRIHREFAYKPGATISTTAPMEAFAARHGVCQDFAHVLIIALRWLGIPAAYVSGYIRTVPPPGKERLVGVDAMHAWVNVWCGNELGWIGLDPTNDCLAGEDHVQIAAGRDYADVAPIDGTFIGAAPQGMNSSVDVAAVIGDAV